MKYCKVALTSISLVLFFAAGCSSKENPKLSLLRNLDHADILKELVSYRESEFWPNENLIFKVDPNEPKPEFPIPYELAAFDPWLCSVFPEDPPRVEFAFWMPSKSWTRDTVSLGYVLNDGEVEEGVKHVEANLNGTKVSVTSVTEKIADSTYLVTPNR